MTLCLCGCRIFKIAPFNSLSASPKPCLYVYDLSHSRPKCYTYVWLCDFSKWPFNSSTRVDTFRHQNHVFQPQVRNAEWKTRRLSRVVYVLNAYKLVIVNLLMTQTNLDNLFHLVKQYNKYKDKCLCFQTKSSVSFNNEWFDTWKNAIIKKRIRTC